VFSVSRSRYALPVQFLFLILNGLGVLFGTVYNINTPDLYVHNAHHRIGWIATWVMTAQVIMSLLFVYAGRTKQTMASAPERAAFLPVSVENMAQHDMRPYADYRWSGDSGQGTDRSSTLHSPRDNSPTDATRRDTFEQFAKPEGEPEDDDEPAVVLPKTTAAGGRTRLWGNNLLDKFLSARVPGLFSARLLRMIEFVSSGIDATILILGFIALTTGVVTYAGIFVSRPIGLFSVECEEGLTDE